MADSPTPVIILVEPQLGENIGTAARAMLNCGLTDLRLVNPRDGWPSEKALAASSGAARVVEAAQIFPTTATALEGLHHVYATTARPRDMNKTVLEPREAAGVMRRAEAAGERNGILFGKEAKGLHNDDVVLASTIIEARLNPEHTSLNLAQAVLLVSWEWWMAGSSGSFQETEDRGDDFKQSALQSDILNMFEHLERELDETEYFYPEEKRVVMVRNLRNIFHRADMTASEVRGMRGVIKALATVRRRRLKHGPIDD
ncbi:MAG: RNA methyltransferase [Rhodospirillaceae bacterium]|nr:RNA methyltransferase [Rhodospirillaceae bacterium]